MEAASDAGRAAAQATTRDGEPPAKKLGRFAAYCINPGGGRTIIVVGPDVAHPEWSDKVVYGVVKDTMAALNITGGIQRMSAPAKLFRQHRESIAVYDQRGGLVLTFGGADAGPPQPGDP